MSAFVIVNPRSVRGSSLRRWRALEKALASIYPHMSVAFTRRRGEATALTASALREGHCEIVVVGGNSTLNETVNGFFDAEGAISPDAVLTCLSFGVGKEFQRVFDRKPGAPDTVSHLKRAAIQPIDIGRVRLLSRDGLPRTRYFANSASFGLSGLIAETTHNSIIDQLFGRRAAFGWHAALGALRYNGRAVRLIVDSGFDEIVNISMVAVTNGQTPGAYTSSAPDAGDVSGLFDVAVIRNDRKRQMLADINRYYSGQKSEDGNLHIVRGRRIVAAPVAETKGRAVLIETDGEPVGRLPATFDILPRALNVRV